MDARAPSPFRTALAAVLRPLEFAARDDFAHLDRVKDLHRSLATVARAAAERAVPPDVRARLASLEADCDEPFEGEAGQKRLSRALAHLRPLATAEWSEAALARGLDVLPGIGPRTAATLARRGLRSILDLLFHLPSRYDDRRSRTRIGALEVGQRATFVGQVRVADFVATRGRFGRAGGRAYQAVVGDESGTVNLRWFRGGDAISKLARKDAWLLVTGEVRRYRFSKELMHPEIERLEGPEKADDDERATLVPDYPTPEGLHPRGLRRAIQRAVADYSDLVPGYLPASAAAVNGLPEPAAALRALHQPGPGADLEALRAGRDTARARLVLEELYLLELGLALRRAARVGEPGIGIAGDGPRTRDAPAGLPFALTGAQQRAWAELRGDLARPHPMNRLLEGDVGSGKTVVAFLAAVAVAEGGYQAALMAPTELLAEQHARTLRRLAAQAPGAGLRVELLSASLSRADADGVRARLAAGEIDLVVGTHALLQPGVAFRRLALVVIDEQHRFGVRQRAALAAKAAGGLVPHTLVMTATPIPRTLALTAWGDLDLSVLDELPPGRAPVKTLLLRSAEAAQAGERLRETVARGEQVYVVYPQVEESEDSDVRAATESAERIRRAFPEVTVELLHGRLDAAARARAMGRFEAGEAPVLVASTVVEVGVDVPEATLMIVEHAERFGLAQLHQLRGRVGRGERPGTCLLVARDVTEQSEARLAALLETTDGFRIAEADLAIRGPGEFLGTRQHGFVLDLRLADLLRDARWVARAREAALAALRVDPGLRGDPELLRAVTARWGERLELAGVG